MFNPVIEVYSVDLTANKAILIGELNKFTTMQWNECFVGYTQFELWAPITDENKELLQPGNIIYPKGRTSCAFIECVKTIRDENGNLSFDITGRTASVLLTKRIIWGMFDKSSSVNPRTLAKEIVDNNIINPTDNNRKLPMLSECTWDDEEIFTNVEGYQKTGGEVYEAVCDLGMTYGFGTLMEFNPSVVNPFKLKLIPAYDKTIDSDNPIVFYASLDDIISSNYVKDVRNLKNVALIAGMGEGEDRIYTTEGSSSGWNRQEVWVDARDVQESFLNEYDVLEYIESHGTQYIDTGFKANNNTSIEYTFESTDFTRTSNLFCCRGADTETNTLTSFVINKIIRFDYGQGTSAVTTSQISQGTKYVVKTEKNKFYLNNSLIGTASATTFNPNISMYFMASFTGNHESISNYAYIKFYGAKIYDNETLARNFIPIKRKSDGAIGLYDLVEGKFYGNNGTGTFGAGPKVNYQVYVDKLKQRGKEKLTENQVIESVEASIRTVGNVQYEFGIDYYIGDIITLVDENLGVQVDALITGFEVDVTSDAGSEIYLTFGYGQPSLLQAIKRKLT